MDLFNLAKRIVQELEPNTEVSEEIVIYPDDLYMGEHHIKRFFMERPIAYEVRGKRTAAFVETAYTLPRVNAEWVDCPWEVPWESAYGISLEKVLDKKPLRTHRVNDYFSWKKEEHNIPPLSEVFEQTDIQEQLQKIHDVSYEPDDLTVLRVVIDCRDDYYHHHIAVPRKVIHDMYKNQQEQFEKDHTGYPVVLKLVTPGQMAQIPSVTKTKGGYTDPWGIKGPFSLLSKTGIRSTYGKSSNPSAGVEAIKTDLELSYEITTKLFQDQELLDLMKTYEKPKEESSNS